MNYAIRLWPPKPQKKLSKARQEAAYAVRQAMKSGVLVNLYRDYHEIQCSDCDRKASCWDHRDYSRPLDVEPVCHGCNNRRGAGINA